MARYINGKDRSQTNLFPQAIDEYISEDNPVRVIDVFVDNLDLKSLGFLRAEPSKTGRPGYHPATLLKIYAYGYMHRIQSSRRLEHETQRNIELIWLTENLSPDFKTIADFRRDNGKAIKKVCAQFVELCRRMGLLAKSDIVVDGSKFKAANSKDQNYTEAKIKARIQQTEKRITRYLQELDTADRNQDESLAPKVEHLKDRLAAAKDLLEEFGRLEKEVRSSPDKQISMSDPDSRSMATRGKGTGIVGYNVQTAVDSKHHLVVAHEVTNKGHDRSMLSNMSKQAKEAVGRDEVRVFADRGYYSGVEILKCEENGIVPMVPKCKTSGAKADGRYDKSDFIYDPKNDVYLCPAGETAIYRFTSIEKGLALRAYWSSKCQQCRLKAKCTPSKARKIRRWEHEDVLDRMQRRLDSMPEASRVRRQTVEHPFGSIKSWMGATHFLMRTMPKVETEMSLHILSYNIKRMISLFGVRGLVKAIQT